MAPALVTEVEEEEEEEWKGELCKLEQSDNARRLCVVGKICLEEGTEGGRQVLPVL